MKPQCNLVGLEIMKETILVEISHAAEWRFQKAIQYPEDERNERCAKSLERLEANVAAVPAANWYFRKLWKAYYGHNLESSEAATLMGELGTIERQCISRYGFDSPQSSKAEEFLKELARRCSTAATAREHRRLSSFCYCSPPDPVKLFR